MKKSISIAFLFLTSITSFAQEVKKEEAKKDQGHTDINKFSQMYAEMATPNMFRTASGAPGPAYYQQRADYKINLELDDKLSKMYGSETVTYYNNAPESLDYLWIQLDQNIAKRDSQTPLIDSQIMPSSTSPEDFTKTYMGKSFDGGFNLEYVKDENGNAMKYTINNTMMRIDLPKALKKGEKVVFSIKWWYNINDYMKDGGNGRSGYELFPDGNKLYVIAQFYPRMCVYNDVEGWQNMQFWGRSEFALTFGNYDVKITVPADHILDGTGVLQNRNEVYTAEQVKRWQLAENSFDKPVIIVTQQEATAAEKGFSTAKKTWHLKAENVRDFAFSTSRKFILDAMAVQVGNNKPMAISLYPKEANPLWENLSTKAVAHTLKTYSKYTFDYPYPKAISVSAEDQGMEYPMICWNFGRPDENGKISDRVKYGMLGVIIHEVGHNFFPMIVNSDERQWTWMDEGLNTFLEYLTEIEFEKDFPVDRGPAKLIVPYMKGNQQFLEPIMSSGDVVYNFGANAYGKPATGLNILRETIMGHELFDHAFKTYANRWKFKHPTPEDFFRTMEDASAVDLDWFWKGWFYSTDVVDLGIKNVKQFYVTENATKETTASFNRRGRKVADAGPLLHIVNSENTELKPEQKAALEKEKVIILNDFLTKNYTVEERAKLKNPKYFYEVEFEKPGSLMMPIIAELNFEDGTKEIHKFPVQIWRRNNTTTKRVFATEKKVVKIQLDPKLETADIDVTNNTWPKEEVVDKFSEIEKK
ncbi:M1 family metallopeptidase [Flavobacterium sp. F372]|uniref:M1 family metallopeptidase n=1 Tax=Flavobacterium bernardetii TaxID=2813823 RepID=A0ABR7IZY1_9FLAO|nr:M1 family metallopeptidase [Flavobacterium bernardetii]MBC5835333.1 M1 family metallopeptidase [Flavobacterium bernardetii]NHF69678.1 M1 family metallopeptidase [Flavobacterium bernardetii]